MASRYARFARRAPVTAPTRTRHRRALYKIMVDRDVATRLLVAHGFLTRCATHPDIVLDEGSGGRPEQVAHALAATCTRFGSREDLEVAIRTAIAAAGDLCPHCT